MMAPPLTSFRRLNASKAFVLCCVFLVSSKSSVSKRPPPPLAAFVHDRAHWRLLLPRGSPQKILSSRRSICGAVDGGAASCAARTPTSLSSGNDDDDDANLIEKIARSLGIDRLLDRSAPLPSIATTKTDDDDERVRGRVVRTAARPQQSSGGSVPSSRRYTTRKPSLPMIAVSESGAAGDYNHYRTVALKSTPDRAISILTADVGSYVRTLDGGHFANKAGGYRDGDLGENVLVEGVDFDFFEVGGRYRFGASSKVKGGGGEAAEGSTEDVVVEVTEMMEPCANLCKLPYINDPSDTPKERLGRCQYLIAALGQKEGLRGWYARVVRGGVIRVGDVVAAAVA